LRMLAFVLKIDAACVTLGIDDDHRCVTDPLHFLRYAI
jgi:hypothetical protein